MSLTFNQFQVELRKRRIDGHMAIVLTTMFEQQRETAEQLDQAMKIMVQLADTVSNFVALNEAMNGRLVDLNKRIQGDVDGVDLSSVSLRDEPRDN